MSKEQQQFISQNLKNPRLQLVENLASESHETNRLPDPYIYVERGGKLLTPEGSFVEESVEKTTYLGKIEFSALEKIQKWASENNEGASVWFSPPFPGKYPVSKFIISEISSKTDTKVLFNRAVVFDVDANSLLDLANSLSDSFYSDNPEALRATPIFPKDNELERWLLCLSPQTDQVKLMQKDHDIYLKTDTYANINDVYLSTKTVGSNSLYTSAYTLAKAQGLIGSSPGSCSTSPATSMEMFMQNSAITNKDSLDCTCPFCYKEVSAPIKNGRIHCPKCKKSAPYAC